MADGFGFGDKAVPFNVPKSMYPNIPPNESSSNNPVYPPTGNRVFQQPSNIPPYPSTMNPPNMPVPSNPSNVNYYPASNPSNGNYYPPSNPHMCVCPPKPSAPQLDNYPSPSSHVYPPPPPGNIYSPPSHYPPKFNEHLSRPYEHYPSQTHGYYPPPPTGTVITSPPVFPTIPPNNSYPSCSIQPNVPHGLIRAYYWVNTTAGRGVPSSAVQGGTDQDGTTIYVGRAFHEGDWIPAKVIPEKNVAYVAYGGEEHAKAQFEVLCEQRFDWVQCHGSSIPPNAVQGGNTGDGEALFVGRVWHDGSHTVGKVQPSHGTCYIPFGGKEVGYADYEILVLHG